MASVKDAWERGDWQGNVGTETPIPEGDKDLWGSPVVQTHTDLATAIATAVCGFSVVSCSCANADELDALHGEIQIAVGAILVKHGIKQ